MWEYLGVEYTSRKELRDNYGWSSLKFQRKVKDGKIVFKGFL